MAGSDSERSSRESYWRYVERTHRGQLIAVAVALVVLALVVLAWALTRSGPAPADSAPSPLKPAEETGAATQTAEPTATVDASPTAPPPTPAPGRAPTIAYRADGGIVVAAEDGSWRKPGYRSAEGVFALSPDGTALAVVDLATAVLTIVDVESGRSVSVGPAVQTAPSWSPESAWLAYIAATNGVAHVARVGRDGSGRRDLFPGASAAVLADGSGLVGVGGDGAVRLVRGDGVAVAVKTVAPADAVAAGPGRLYYAVDGFDAASAPTLRSVALDGSGDVALRTGPPAEKSVAFRELAVSPRGDWLSYVEMSDDGYSRLWCTAADGSVSHAFSTRLDTYPLRWSADGTRLFFIEGNAFQGEATSLFSALPDGGGRIAVSTGASR